MKLMRLALLSFALTITSLVPAAILEGGLSYWQATAFAVSWAMFAGAMNWLDEKPKGT